MYPDEGIVRFSPCGTVIPLVPSDPQALIDTDSVKNGGVGVDWSDQHFGTAGNLLLTGRGHDMSDGWETKRSRTPGHVDWVIIKLGYPTKIDEVVVDTAHYKGNFPQKIVIKGLLSDEEKPSFEDDRWNTIVPESKTGPHQLHFYKKSDGKLINTNDIVYNFVSLTIIPDGGVKRLRVIGRKADD